MDDTLDDFISKYRNCYVWLSLQTGDILTQFSDYDKENLTFYQPEIGAIQISFNKAKQVIKTKFPRKGLYNMPTENMAFFYRIPARQYKRSPHETNCVLVIPGTSYTHAINFDNLNQCFNPVYPNKAKALVKINAGAASVALSEKFGISITGVPNRFDVWFYNNIVAGIENDKVTVFYEPLRQEIIDFFGEDLTWKI